MEKPMSDLFDNECIRDGCTNDSIADWGVCGDHFLEISKEIRENVIESE